MSEMIERVTDAVDDEIKRQLHEGNFDPHAMTLVVIKTMRTPTQDMALAGFDRLDREVSPHAAEACWFAMIDEILTPSPSPSPAVETK